MNKEIREGITKQQKLRGALADVILERHRMTRDEALWESLAYMRFLHSQGVVLKADGEWPTIFDYNDDVITALEYKKKLKDFTRFEPLVKE